MPHKGGQQQQLHMQGHATITSTTMRMERLKKMCLGVCVCSFLIYLTIYTYNGDIVTVAWNRTVHYLGTPPPPLYYYDSSLIDKDPNKLNFTWIDNHPVYKRFYLQNVEKKERRTVVVVVSSAPKRVDRRNAIRRTWWKQCVGTGPVMPECVFVTDYQV